MRKPWSPNLLSLISLGLILAVLPLIAVIVTTVAQVDRLARNSSADMLAVRQDTAASSELVERGTLMERSARQFQAVEDDSYRQLFAGHRDSALQVLRRLVNGKTDKALLEAAADVERSAETLNELLQAAAPAPAGEFDAAVTSFRQALLRVTQAQAAISRQLADSVPEKAQRLKRNLLIQALLVIPLSALLALVFFFVIRTPLRQISQSIRALGRGTLGKPVTVEGPRDLEDLGRRLEWLRRRLVELEAQKSQFLRNVSHELKTPLTNIREGSQLLLDGRAADDLGEIGEVARIVKDNSVRLQQMIETLLRYGADGDLEAGRQREPLQFDQIVAEIVERQATAASARSVSFRTSIEPARVTGNSKCLEVIVDNLVSNALKYTPEGGTIEVRLRAGPELTRLEVKDDGPGVSEGDRPHIFEWFYKGPPPPQAVIAGTGMGLAIAQEYAQQHGGQIELLPGPGGAHFRLTIPTGTDA